MIGFSNVILGHVISHALSQYIPYFGEARRLMKDTLVVGFES
jgi:hypothetical protein